MGFFDFGDKAMIKTLAGRLMVGVDQLAREFDHSGGTSTPMARGLAFALNKDIKEMLRLSNSLSESSRTSILINMEGRNVQLPAFFFTLKMMSDDWKNKTGLCFFE